MYGMLSYAQLLRLVIVVVLWIKIRGLSGVVVLTTEARGFVRGEPFHTTCLVVTPLHYMFTYLRRCKWDELRQEITMFDSIIDDFIPLKGRVLQLLQWPMEEEELPSRREEFGPF